MTNHFCRHALGGLVGSGYGHAARAPGLRSLTLMKSLGQCHPHTARCFLGAPKQLLAAAVPARLCGSPGLPCFSIRPTWIADHIQQLQPEDLNAMCRLPPVETALRRIDALLTFDPGEALRRCVAQPPADCQPRRNMLVPMDGSRAQATAAEILSIKRSNMVSRPLREPVRDHQPRRYAILSPTLTASCFRRRP